MAKRKYSDGPAASTDSSDVESSRGAEFKVLSTNRDDVESSLGVEYEVFLNFRGPDTRLNFTDCLYHSMDVAGIRVFRDEEEIRKGEAIGGELERAIKSCTICIPIFSKNYASSAWCLRELAYMVDSKAMILPIFFDVEPKDVKLKTELYQEALQEHEEKYGCEVVQRWKEALREVTRIKGWDLKNRGDLGREIVQREDKVPGKRSRLWCPKIALNIVQTRKGTETIIALKLTGLSMAPDFTSENFSRLPSLRLLELEGGNLVGDFKNLLSSLRWLSWRRCPSNLQAVNLYLGKLVVLKLLDSKIPENWNGWGPCLVNPDLKVIHLMRCHLSTTPDFSTCLNLRILVFYEHDPKLLQFDSSVEKLEHLKCLETIPDAGQLSMLWASLQFDLFAVPSAIWGLKYLTSLMLCDQCVREVPASIGELESLTRLSLEGCDQLRVLPDSIGKLRSLVTLNLSFTKIRELPDSIGDLKRLEEMNVRFTQIRELPNSIGGLGSLLDLNLYETEIRELPNSIGDLKKLKQMCLKNTQIRELPNSIGGLESLLELSLLGTKITELPASFGSLEKLEYLVLAESKMREPSEALRMPKNLKDLNYGKIFSFGWKAVLPKEEGNLDIDTTWPPQLYSLNMSCDDPRSLPRLPFVLRRLELRDVKSPIELSFFSNLRYLSELTLSKCCFREIEFRQMENLVSLTVVGCESLVRLSGLLSLGNLKELKVDRCPQLIEIRDLEELESRGQLSIWGCPLIQKLRIPYEFW